MQRCDGCPFLGKLVGTRGPEDSELVIVGESPGMKEIREDLPFVGPSGVILNAGLQQHPDIVPYITNAHLCFPGTTKQKSQDKVIQATQCCHERLIEEIKQHPRKVILALGNAALWSLTGNYQLKITQVRGQVFESFLSERGIVASVHPSYLMHGNGSLRQFLADVDYACSLVKGNDFRKYIIPEVKLIEDETALRALADDMKTLPPGTVVAADVETGGWDGFDFLRDRILCAGICWEPSTVYTIPEELIPLCNDLIHNECRFVWHNGKFDAKFFRAASVRNVRVDEDTMLLSYALDETKGIHDLESVGSDIIGVPDWKFMIQPYLVHAKQNKNFSPKLTLNKKGELVQETVTYDCIPRDILYDYMSRDISTTLQVFPILRRNVRQDPKLELLYTKTLIPASEYLLEAEETGLKLDFEQVNKNTERLYGKEVDGKWVPGEISKYANEINAISLARGHQEINCNSWQQLGVLLFDVLKLPSKNGRSTDVKALDALPQHPVVIALKRHRKVQKAYSTYVKSAPGWVNKDGRVHTTYKIHGTATGRLASEEPNLLNIPRDPLIRGQFVVDDGDVLLEVDANQAELRVLAEVSGDKELTRIYTTKGESLHDIATVKIILKAPIADLSPAEHARLIEKFNVQNFPEKLYDEAKMRAKNVNFGIVYGVTAHGLSEQTDNTPKECQEWLDTWFKTFPEAAIFMRKCREAPIKGQTLVTPFGRKKRFGVVSQERIIDIQNQAMNFPAQSIASDIVLHTGMEIAEKKIHHRYNARIVNTIYDSILYQMPNNEASVRELANITIETLERKAREWGLVRIPFLGEAKCGFRWGSLMSLDKMYKAAAA